MSSTDNKYDILSKTSSLKGIRIFINEDLILKDQAKLRKEVQKVKEARKEGKWAIIRNRKPLFEIETKKIVINSNSTCSRFFLGTVRAFHGTKAPR